MNALALVSLMILPGVEKAEPLAREWHGKWEGKLRTGTLEVPMTLEVKPIEGGKVLWVMRYAATKKIPAMTKNYQLVAVSGKPDQFEMDEKNGVRIATRLTPDGKSLVSLFRVGTQYLQTKYTLTADGLRFELFSFSEKGGLKTKSDRGEMEVESFTFTATQSADLKKAK